MPERTQGPPLASVKEMHRSPRSVPQSSPSLDSQCKRYRRRCLVQADASNNFLGGTDIWRDQFLFEIRTIMIQTDYGGVTYPTTGKRLALRSMSFSPSGIITKTNRSVRIADARGAFIHSLRSSGRIRSIRSALVIKCAEMRGVCHRTADDRHEISCRELSDCPTSRRLDSGDVCAYTRSFTAPRS